MCIESSASYEEKRKTTMIRMEETVRQMEDINTTRLPFLIFSSSSSSFLELLDQKGYCDKHMTCGLFVHV